MRLAAARRAAWITLAVVYGPFGLLHMRRPEAFLPIMPPWVPYPREVVIGTGAAELLGAVGLLIPGVRRWAALGLAAYAVGVFPANLHHALSGVDVPPLPSSWWYHAPRLLFQPVFVWAALFAGGWTRWPFRPDSPHPAHPGANRGSTTHPAHPDESRDPS